MLYVRHDFDVHHVDILTVPAAPLQPASLHSWRLCDHKRKKLLAEAKSHDNVYPLLASRQMAKALSVVSGRARSGLDWVTVHARLGHLNTLAIQLLHDKQMALGMDMPTRGSPDDVKQCEGCAIGKAHRLPFPSSGQPPQLRDRCSWCTATYAGRVEVANEVSEGQAAGDQVVHTELHRRLQPYDVGGHRSLTSAAVQ